MKKATIGFTIIFIFIIVGGANALTLSKVNGAWSNINGDINLNQFLQFKNDHSEVRWGRGYPHPNEQSGLSFIGSSPHMVQADNAFLLGSITHFNQAILLGTGASTADLSVSLEFDNEPVLSYSFDIAFEIDETPNTIPELSDDHISFSYDNHYNQSFFIDSNEYTFSVLGFMNSDGDYINQFDSAESNNNRAYLYGQISSYDGGQQAAVPEPATYLLLASGLIALTALKKRRYI